MPYRNIGYPPISLWEHRNAIKNLRTHNQTQINEDMIFRTIEQLREITKKSAAKQKSSRRLLERTINTTKIKELPKPNEDITKSKNTSLILDTKLFDDVEAW